MATNKESTLQINKFEGIDQYNDGTVIPPSKFFNLQNYYVKSEGELKALNGVTNLTSNSLAGVTSIKHSKFLEFDNSLLALYSPNYTTIPTPSGQTFSTSGGTAVSHLVTIIYVGAGNSYTKATYATQSIQLNGLTVNLPTNIPSYIFCVHVYIEALAGGFSGQALWSGSFTRVNGSFPASILCPIPPATVATASPITISGRPASFTSTFGTGGNLLSGKIYYFGFCPWVGGKNQSVAFFDNSSKGYAVYLPSGQSSITCSLNYLPAGVSQNDVSPTTTDLDYQYIVAVCGLTIEDGLPIGASATDGTQLPVATSNQSVSFNNSSGVSVANNQITVSGTVPSLALLKYTTVGTPPTGMANNTYYWVRNPVYSGGNTSFNISATVSGPLTTISVVGSGTGVMNWKSATFTLKQLPQNSDLWAMADDLNTDGSRVGKATNPRLTGIINLNDTIADPLSVVPKGLGGCVLTQLPHIPSQRREILSCRQQKGLSINDHTTAHSVPDEFFVDSSSALQSRTYVGRLWCVNGFNSPFYSNGYVLKPATIDSTSTFFPITNYIEFFQDRLMLAGGNGDTVTYSKGTFAYSDAGNPNSVGAAGVPNSKPVRFGDESDIRGVALYSQDLSTLGPQTYFIVGKKDSIYTWSGDTTVAAQQIDRKTGFAGPNCFTRTRFGPVFVGRDNVYYLQNSSLLIPMGDDVRNIIQALTDDQLLLVDVIDHEEQVKISYPSSLTGQLDREVWMKFIYNNGGISKKWSGPHLLKPLMGQAITSEFGGERDYRISFIDNNLYRRDDPGSFLNDGAPIQHSIRINRLGMNQDHFLKVINRVYMALRIVQDEEFDITIQTEDGSISAVFSETADFDDGERQLKQVWIPQRMLARIFSISIENASAGDQSIYDISFLYQSLRRRALP